MKNRDRKQRRAMDLFDRTLDGAIKVTVEGQAPEIVAALAQRLEHYFVKTPRGKRSLGRAIRRHLGEPQSRDIHAQTQGRPGTDRRAFVAALAQILTSMFDKA
jgi:hypothetical protein